MFRTVLVPLDGSELAEHVLPLAAGLAERALGTLRLVRVHDTRPAAQYAAELTETDLRRQEQAYLDAVAGRLKLVRGVAADTALLDGPVATALGEEARRVQAGLIALTTHGRGPLSRAWLGSVADELLRHAPVPLLIHRPAQEGPTDLGAAYLCHRILVPLDGSEVGDAALAPAAELARLFGADVTLLRVVEPVPVLAPDGMGYLPPVLEGPLLDEMTTQARTGLDQTAARLRSAGLRVDGRVVVHELVAGAILEAAESADLIALATHGRGRVARFFLGSVADKVVRGAPCPVFVVRCHPTAGGPP
jgi:nucleotide-binding universal stress UspA family protein